MRKLDILFTFAILLVVSLDANGLPTISTEKFPLVVTPDPAQILAKQNKTISELVKEQTETIKKIVAAQKPPYPILDRPDLNKDSELSKQQELEEQIKQLKIKQEKEKQSIEDLRQRCQHFFKFGNYENGFKAKSGDSQKQVETTPIPTVQAFGPQIKPDFLKQKTTATTPKTKETPAPTEVKKESYFIFSDEKYTTEAPKTYTPESTYYDLKPEETSYGHPTLNSLSQNAQYNINNYNNLPNQQVVQTLPSQPVKYVKYEPVIFQKTLVSNGQNYYYWYRAMPKSPSLDSQDILQPQSSNLEQVKNIYSTPKYDILPSTINPSSATYFTKKEVTTTTSAPQSTTKINIPTWKTKFITKAQTPSTTAISTSTSELIPMYDIIYNAKKTIAAPHKPQKSDQRHVSKTKPSGVDLDELHQNQPTKYKSELRFILPMAFSAIPDVVPQYPWNMDPYAYYPKQMQPDIMNIQVPYVPTFHMIRTLSVPNKDEVDNYHRESITTR